MYREAKPFMSSILEATHLYLRPQQYLQKASLSRRWRNHSLMSLNDSLDTFSRAHAKISCTMRTRPLIASWKLLGPITAYYEHWFWLSRMYWAVGLIKSRKPQPNWIQCLPALMVTRFGVFYNWPQYQTDLFKIFALSFFFALLRIISIKNNYFHYL